MNPATASHLERLKLLAEQAGHALFERAGLALEVLADDAWVAEWHDGDCRFGGTAVAELYFSDMVVTGWFERMLIVRKHFPESIWGQHRFNLQRLWIRYEEERKRNQPKPPPRKQAVPVRLHEEVKEELESKTEQLAKREERIIALERQNEELKETVKRSSPCEAKQKNYSHSNGRGVENRNPILMAEVATARDLADMVSEMILRHPDSETVREIVSQRLTPDKLRKAKKPTMLETMTA